MRTVGFGRGVIVGGLSVMINHRIHPSNNEPRCIYLPVERGTWLPGMPRAHYAVMSFYASLQSASHAVATLMYTAVKRYIFYAGRARWQPAGRGTGSDIT